MADTPSQCTGLCALVPFARPLAIVFFATAAAWIFLIDVLLSRCRPPSLAHSLRRHVTPAINRYISWTWPLCACLFIDPVYQSALFALALGYFFWTHWSAYRWMRWFGLVAGAGLSATCILALAILCIVLDPTILARHDAMSPGVYLGQSYHDHHLLGRHSPVAAFHAGARFVESFRPLDSHIPLMAAAYCELDNMLITVCPNGVDEFVRQHPDTQAFTTTLPRTSRLCDRKSSSSLSPSSWISTRKPSSRESECLSDDAYVTDVLILRDRLARQIRCYKSEFAPMLDEVIRKLQDLNNHLQSHCISSPSDLQPHPWYLEYLDNPLGSTCPSPRTAHHFVHPTVATWYCVYLRPHVLWIRPSVQQLFPVILRRPAQLRQHTAVLLLTLQHVFPLLPSATLRAFDWGQEWEHRLGSLRDLPDPAKVGRTLDGDDLDVIQQLHLQVTQHELDKLHLDVHTAAQLNYWKDHVIDIANKISAGGRQDRVWDELKEDLRSEISKTLSKAFGVVSDSTSHNHHQHQRYGFDSFNSFAMEEEDVCSASWQGWGNLTLCELEGWSRRGRPIVPGVGSVVIRPEESQQGKWEGTVRVADLSPMQDCWQRVVEWKSLKMSLPQW
ncbi:hypothetical protein M409DRAFT_29500 [Zasmidium cellare ATCC 36951]|uniref:Uncharacterized protein n=1 Tax=Zasmidium cellare ATCC 36951 TaxID=1080233 RepID=A0A6A6C1L7_ZASCE|nr:uncharacterized protein M409DRAFT_29500 [Zasmidium cellare ATCC 36951]KAF2160050.1 hypothetical protein M409DRAFT_29500 [Zasmidium cellare ATCC 36951]